MEINKLSAQIDQKLSELEQRLVSLQTQQQKSSEPPPQLQADIDALLLVKDKLTKSRDLAWRAHRLQASHQDHKQLEQRRWIGLLLCALSALGMVVLTVIWWTKLR
jgi:hypothetical protein